MKDNFETSISRIPYTFQHDKLFIIWKFIVRPVLEYLAFGKQSTETIFRNLVGIGYNWGLQIEFIDNFVRVFV